MFRSRSYVILLVLLVAAVLVAGCGGGDKPEEQQTPSVKQQAEEEPFPENSYDKIYGELLSGNISEEKAVALSLQATFAPDSLPGEYKGVSTAGDIELNPELQWIHDNWESLSAEAKEKFKPFILEPDQPGSYFNPENKDENEGILTRLSFVRPAYAADGPWESLTFTPAGHDEMVRIYYASPGAPEAEKETMKNKAIKVKEAFTKAWPMYKELLLVEPTAPFKVWLINLEGGLNGGAIWHTAENRCSVLLKKTLNDKKLQSTAVHELFHCFQYYVGQKFRISDLDINWLLEATAKWSEDFVYPDYNVEQEWLNLFFKTLDKERVYFSKGREYSSYMLFFFLSQYLGDDQHIPKILNSAKNGQVRDAVMNSLENFADAYAEFALYNWNQEPWQAYQDLPKFPNGSPAGDAVEELLLDEPLMMDYTVPNIDMGGIKYIRHTFNSDKVKRVEFDFLTASQDENLKRQALIKTGDTWTLEDWNNLTKREFCRRNPAEKVKEVVLVFSNADLKNIDTATYFIRIDGDCEVAAGGYTRVTETLISGQKSIQMEFMSRDEIKYYDKEYVKGDAFVMTKRTMNYSSRDHTETVWPGAGPIKGTITGSGSLTETYELNEDAPLRLVLNRERTEGYILVDPDRKNTEWVTFSHTLTGADPYSEKGDIGGVGGALGALPRYDLEASEITSQGVKGQRVFETGSDGMTQRTVVEFEYVLPE